MIAAPRERVLADNRASLGLLRGLSAALAWAATTPVLTRREALYHPEARQLEVERRRALLGGTKGAILLFADLDELVDGLHAQGVPVDVIWSNHRGVMVTPTAFGLTQVAL